MYCPNCGRENQAEENFCRDCGQSLNDSLIAEESSEDQTLATFVGKNYPYYQRKWEIAHDPATAASWNGAGFFLGIFWLGYRRMFKPMFAIFLFYLIVGLIGVILDNEDLLSIMTPFINIGTTVLIGVYGNALYYRHAKKKLAEFEMTQATERDISLAGGTSVPGALLALGSLILFVFAMITMYAYFLTAGVVFGTDEGASGVTGIKDTFSQDELIYYEVEFGERISAPRVDVHVLEALETGEQMLGQFEVRVDPSWQRFYDYLYDPTQDLLEPGRYIVRIYRDGEKITEGRFEIEGMTY
ncbi:DUF2628 domain-containing protein [Amphibacillus jilinensis]|uniref:DUF2628 domain-containing protein n=1 Tax=Amphibacillus jilinensis TaxID=1216008 RepID=UPI00030CB124|nr:DUF2628 domain-containing protein [Amphibacillus jilinensis]